MYSFVALRRKKVSEPPRTPAVAAKMAWRFLLLVCDLGWGTQFVQSMAACVAGARYPSFRSMVLGKMTATEVW